MKKYLLAVLICLLTVSLASSYQSLFITDDLKEGSSKAYKVDDGWYVLTLTIVSDSKRMAKFKLNEEISSSLKERDEYEFKDGSKIIVKTLYTQGGTDEADYYFYASGRDPLDIEPNEDIEPELCNFDGGCSDNEDQEDCCYDCGCERGYKCSDNKCEEIIGCIENEDCDDNDSCSEDRCMDNECEYELNDGCDLNGTCYDIGSNQKVERVISYCDGGWHAKKTEGLVCEKNYECLTGECKGNVCYRKKSNFTTWLMIITVFLISVGIIMHWKITDMKRMKNSFNRFIKDIRIKKRKF